MNILNKLERRLGRYALRNLMRYVVALYVAGLVIGVINPYAFTLLSLNFNEIARGQVWRLVTFIVPQSSIYNIIFVFFKAYIFYIIGNALERAWARRTEWKDIGIKARENIIKLIPEDPVGYFCEKLKELD